MCFVSKSEMMLNCKTKRWNLVCLTCNIIMNQNENSSSHKFGTEFVLMSPCVSSNALVKSKVVSRLEEMSLAPTDYPKK